jgi:hypothetical protein
MLLIVTAVLEAGAAADPMTSTGAKKDRRDGLEFFVSSCSIPENRTC